MPFVILHVYVKQLNFGGTGENSISIFLNDQTREGLQTCVKSFVIIVWFSPSI